ncbi:MAG: hypothetical protein ACE5FD_12425 [Anaerolineae bacterium]
MTTVMRPNRRTRAQLKQLTQLAEFQAVLGWGVILVIAAVLGTIFLRQSSRIATTGRQVQILQNQLIDLKRENSIIERQIAGAQSLERLQAEAVRLGFVPARPEDIEYVIVPNYPVETTAVPENEEPVKETAVSPPETIREALWLTVKDSINTLVKGEAHEE